MGSSKQSCQLRIHSNRYAQSFDRVQSGRKSNMQDPEASLRHYCSPVLLDLHVCPRAHGKRAFCSLYFRAIPLPQYTSSSRILVCTDVSIWNVERTTITVCVETGMPSRRKPCTR